MTTGREGTVPRCAPEVDADARTREREAVPIVIGEQVFYRRCRNHAVTREVGHLDLRRDVSSRRAEQARRHAREGEAAAYDQEALDTTLRIAAILLRDEAGSSPDIDLLKANAGAAAAVATDGIAAIQAATEVLRYAASRLADVAPMRPMPRTDRGIPRRRVRPCNRARGGRPGGRRQVASRAGPSSDDGPGEPEPERGHLHLLAGGRS